MKRIGCRCCRRSKEPGWTCAEHPGKAWEHRGCRAEATPCACNPQGRIRWKELFADNRPVLQ